MSELKLTNYGCVLILMVFILTAKGSLLAQMPQPDTIIVYKVMDGYELNLYIFYPENMEKEKAKTAIVSFFGGGWTGGNPRQFYPHSAFYATKGIIGISAEYRIAKVHRSSPFDAVEDAKSAIRWVRSNAEYFGISKDRIVASGGSAGGHLAACTGVVEGYENDSEELLVSSVPNAMVLFNPVLDTTEKGYGVKKMKGDSLSISPNHHIRSDLPPVITFHGDADKTVPIENALTFDKKMKANGNMSRLVVFEHVGHGFFNSSEFRKDNDPKYFNETMSETMIFLEEVGILKD